MISRKGQIADAYVAGRNTAEIAREFGVTRQRVEQIAREQGLPHRYPARGKTS